MLNVVLVMGAAHLLPVLLKLSFVARDPKLSLGRRAEQ